jgi:ATPase family AAA domain-containing protein 2
VCVIHFQEREEILKIHVSKWDEQPTPELLSEMAELSDGYCGADLRSLCSEAVLQSLRRRYPQIYNSSAKLLLDTDQVQVCRSDFLTAKAQIVPASYRMSKSFGKRLPQFVAPLVQSEVERATTTLAQQFPHINEKSTAK